MLLESQLPTEGKHSVLGLYAVSFSVRTAPYEEIGDYLDELVIRRVSQPDTGVQC